MSVGGGGGGDIHPTLVDLEKLVNVESLKLPSTTFEGLARVILDLFEKGDNEYYKKSYDQAYVSLQRGVRLYRLKLVPMMKIDATVKQNILIKIKRSLASAEVNLADTIKVISSRPALGYKPNTSSKNLACSTPPELDTQTGLPSQKLLKMLPSQVLGYLGRDELNLIFFDVRPVTEFVSGHVKVSNAFEPGRACGCINIDPRELRQGMSSLDLKALLQGKNPKYYELFSRRKNAHAVILYDYSTSKFPDYQAASPLRFLFDALFEREFEFSPKEPILIEGGWTALKQAIDGTAGAERYIEYGQEGPRVFPNETQPAFSAPSLSNDSIPAFPTMSLYRPPQLQAALSSSSLSTASSSASLPKPIVSSNVVQTSSIVPNSISSLKNGVQAYSLTDSLPYLYASGALAPQIPAKAVSAPVGTVNSASLLRFWQIFQRGAGAIKGIKNLGNTCYMSCILQCLYGTTPLSLFFISGEYRRQINMQNKLGTGGAIVEAFATLMRQMAMIDGQSVLNTARFREVLTGFAPQFAGKMQHDAQEFLSVLLDMLHEDLNGPRTHSKQRGREPTKADEEGPPALLAEKTWTYYRELNQSVIVDFFQGQLENALQCTVCFKESRSFNSLMYLSLPIPVVLKRPSGVAMRPGNFQSSGLDLYDCLDEFVTREVLDGADAWKCPRCNVARRATKTLSIARPPNVLLVHLKRFSFDGPFRDKIDLFVDFPIKTLDLAKYVPAYMKGPHEQFHYTLFAVSNHYGTLTGGHYTAYVFDFDKRRWNSFDDTSVSKMSNEHDIKSKAAYILFYVRTI